MSQGLHRKGRRELAGRWVVQLLRVQGRNCWRAPAGWAWEAVARRAVLHKCTCAAAGGIRGAATAEKPLKISARAGCRAACLPNGAGFLRTVQSTHRWRCPGGRRSRGRQSRPPCRPRAPRLQLGWCKGLLWVSGVRFTGQCVHARRDTVPAPARMSTPLPSTHPTSPAGMAAGLVSAWSLSRTSRSARVTSTLCAAVFCDSMLPRAGRLGAGRRAAARAYGARAAAAAAAARLGAGRAARRDVLQAGGRVVGKSQAG